jgi:hypothetical protein
MMGLLRYMLSVDFDAFSTIDSRHVSKLDDAEEPQ